MFRRILPVLLLAAAACPSAWALQMQDATLISPVTGKPFPALVVPREAERAASSANLGVDTDGCRHDSGISEYDFAVTVDPHSYFTALTAEWDVARGGRFGGVFTPETKAWVIDALHSDWQTDVANGYGRAVEIARAQGQAVPERGTWVLPQAAIPSERKFALAMKCYAQRGARASVIAKIALTGAWSLRCRMNVSVAHSSLDGGYQEMAGRIRQAVEVKDDEEFNLQKWLPAYRKVFESSGMSNEGALVTGLTLFGMELRDGDLNNATKVLDELKKRFSGLDRGELLKGMVRERAAALKQYTDFTEAAAMGFINALANEELVRRRMPEVLLVTGESFRRVGRRERAIDWYLALSRLPETQPQLRKELREDGKVKALPADKPYHVQLGWIADEMIERLARDGVVHPGEIAGPDKALLTAVLFDGLGTAAYGSPNWKPAKDGNSQDCAVMLDLVGKAVLDHAFRLGTWPVSLGELWEKEVIDRNRVNRFHCPVTGKAFLYAAPTIDVEKIAPSTVLVATAEPMPTNQGPRYAAFCASLKVIWSEQPLNPGQPAP